MIRLAFFLIIGCIAGIWVGVRGLIDWSRSSGTPVHISLDQLTREQIKTNPYVTIDNVFIDGYDATFGTSHNKGVYWMPAITVTPEFINALKAWHTAHPNPGNESAARDLPRPQNVILIVKASDTPKTHALDLMAQSSVTGMLVDDEVGIFASGTLTKKYPGLDPRLCMVLDEGAKPDPSAAAGTIVIGILSGVGAVALFKSSANAKRQRLANPQPATSTPGANNTMPPPLPNNSRIPPR